MKYRRFAGKAAAFFAAAVLMLGMVTPAFAAEAADAVPGEEIVPVDAAPAEENPGAYVAAAEENAQTDPAAAVEWPGYWDGVSADTACLMDASTGIVLYDKNMEQKMYPASVTKIMTTLLALENGNLSDQVAMTAEGTQYAVSGSSNLYTQVGEIFTLEQLLYGTMLRSANDMATQVGYHIGGNSLDNFFQMMNNRAASLGARNTHFHSACGMPDEEHWTCAYDLALIMSQAIRLPMFRTICQTREYAIPPTNLNSETRMFASHNLLLVDENYAYPGLIGGKTGYTDAAQSTLVEAASRDGLDLVAVVLHEPDTVTAAMDTIRMMDFGFANFQSIEVGKPEYTVYGGRALLPKGVSRESLVIDEGEPYETAEGSFVRWEYLLDGRTVGYTVMTAANAEAYHVELYGPTDTPTPEPGATGTQSRTSSDPSAPVPTAAPAKPEGNRSGNITSILFTVLLVIACIAAVSAVVCAILLHKAKVEARKARRRKMELRRRAMEEEKAREEEALKSRMNASKSPYSNLRILPRQQGKETSSEEEPIGAGPSPAVKDAAARYIERQEARKRAMEKKDPDRKA